jgi:hypothetical protein
MTTRQVSVRFGEVADEFMSKDDAGLGTAVLTGGDMQIAAADSRVGDVDSYPARAGFRHWNWPDGHDVTAFPHQRVLLSHRRLRSLSRPTSRSLMCRTQLATGTVSQPG